MINTFFSTN